MGTFAGFYGNRDIKEELLNEYIENVLKVLKYGGMVQFEKVNIFDEEIALIKNPTADKNGIVRFHYNYFGDEAWETAGFNTTTGHFYSNKIGWAEFNFVISAIYVLTEFYTKEFGMAEVNGEVFDANYYIGWLNYILNKKFTNIRAVDAFKILEINPDIYDINAINEIVTGCKEQEAVNLGSLMIFLYLFKDKNGIWDELEKNAKENDEQGNINLPRIILKSKYYINKLKDNKTYEDMLDYILSPDKYRDNLKDGSDESGFCFVSIFLNTTMALLLLCEAYNKDFWDEYNNKKELLQSKADDLWSGKLDLLKPVEKIKTDEFLDLPDSSLCFMRTTFSENYHKSDDDFCYFYRDIELNFSDEFNNWCKDLSKNFDDIFDSSFVMNSTEGFMKDLMNTLSMADEYYKRIFAYQEMFYEFLTNSNKREYQAALILFKKVLEDNKELGSVIEEVNSWDIADRNLTFNKGRLNVKRFLAIMANKELRNKIFRF